MENFLIMSGLTYIGKFYYRKYVILVMYIHAKNAFIHHDYDTCLAELWSVKTIAWRFKWAKRLLLLVISWIKSK